MDGETELVSDGARTETQEASRRERTPFLPCRLDPLPEPHTGSSKAAALPPLCIIPHGACREGVTREYLLPPKLAASFSFPGGDLSVRVAQ